MSTGEVLPAAFQHSMATADENIPSFYGDIRETEISSSKDWSQASYSPVGEESISSSQDWSKLSPMSYTQDRNDSSPLSPQDWTNLTHTNNLQFTEVPLDSVLSPSISKGMNLEQVGTPEEEYVTFADCEVSTSSSQEVKEERSTALKYPPCAVCTGKSSGLHYGCYTCEACKNFFRRYLLRNDGFNCKKRGNCAITNRSRGNCSGCRLKKCLVVGMSKEKSKIGRYTHAQRTETIREVNKLEGKAMEEDDRVFFNHKGNSPDSITALKVKSEIKVEVEEDSEYNWELLAKLIEGMERVQPFGEHGSTEEGRLDIIKEHYEKYLAKVKLFGPLGAIPKDEFFTLLKLYNIDLDERWNIFKREANNCEHIVRKYVDYAYNIPGFRDELSKKDQEMLLKLGHSDFFVILMHEGYIEEYNIFLEMNGVPSHVEEAADKIFSRQMIEMQCNIFKKWQKLNLAKEEMALLIAMAIVSSDRCELENQELVESMHSRLTNLLMKYLEANYGSEAHKRFAKFIDVLVICRYGSELYYKEYQEMSENQMVTEAAPKFPTLCPDKS